jgi:hypothetical protein
MTQRHEGSESLHLLGVPGNRCDTAPVSSAVMTAEPAVQRPTRPDWWLLDRLALVWSAATALVVYALIGRGGWYVDDFLNYGLAKERPFNRAYVDLPIFGHPQQGTRVLNWVLYRISPMNYQLASALICLGIGAMTYLVYRILRLSFRPSPWHLVLTAMVSTTGVWAPVAAWWAAATEIAACMVTTLLTVHAMLCCYRGPWRLLWGVLAGWWLLVGLAFYERTLFGGVFAAWFLLAVACRSARPRDVLAVLRRAWSGYLALLMVAAGYLLYYTSHHFVRRQPGYSRRELVHFLWVCWSNTLIPGLFGGPLRTSHNDVLTIAHPQLWWLIACQLGLLALVGYGVLRNRLRAVLAWLVFLALFLPAQYTIATARLRYYHWQAGQQFRYLADLLPLLVLTIAIAILRRADLLASRVVDGEPAAAERTAGWHWRQVRQLDRRHLLATGAVLAGLWLVFLISAVPVGRLWVHSRHVTYVHNLRAGVLTQDRHGPWSLYTTYTPPDVSPFGYGHYSQTPVVASLVTDRPVSADDLSKPMFVVTQEGQIQPAKLQTAATVPDTCSTKRDKIMLPLSQPLDKDLWNLQLRYKVSAPTVLRFALDPGNGRPVEATGSFRLFRVSGSGQLTFAIRPTSIKALRFDTAAVGGCISDVRIGTPQPTG